MNKKGLLVKIGALGAVAVTAITLTACGKSSVVGRWYSQGGYITTFESNGEWYDNAVSSGTYTVSGNKLTMVDSSGREDILTINGNKLEMDGEVVAEKQ